MIRAHSQDVAHAGQYQLRYESGGRAWQHLTDNVQWVCAAPLEESSARSSREDASSGASGLVCTSKGLHRFSCILCSCEHFKPGACLSLALGVVITPTRASLSGNVCMLGRDNVSCQSSQECIWWLSAEISAGCVVSAGWQQ